MNFPFKKAKALCPSPVYSLINDVIRLIVVLKKRKTLR